MPEMFQPRQIFNKAPLVRVWIVLNIEWIFAALFLLRCTLTFFWNPEWKIADIESFNNKSFK